MNIRKNTQQPTLLSPGPVMLSPNVKQAAINTIICHRYPAFSELYARIETNLERIAHFGNEYQSLLLTGSGTAANEAVISSAAGLGTILVLSNGEFGERLYYLSRLYDTTAELLNFGWSMQISLEAVEKRLARGGISTVIMVHHETSTGMLNPVARVAQIAKRHGCHIIVDAVSSLGADELRISDWEIDVATSSSGKALHAMPGIGIVMARHSILEAISQQEPKSHYLSLAKYYEAAHKKKQTPNTPAVNLLAALEAATSELVAEGGKHVARRAWLFRKNLQAHGLGFMNHGDNTSSVLTCVILPAHVTFTEIARRLYEENIIAYDGKGQLQGKILQVGHIGFFAAGQYQAATDKVLDVLSSFGDSQTDTLEKN